MDMNSGSCLLWYTWPLRVILCIPWRMVAPCVVDRDPTPVCFKSRRAQVAHLLRVWRLDCFLWTSNCLWLIDCHLWWCFSNIVACTWELSELESVSAYPLPFPKVTLDSPLAFPYACPHSWRKLDTIGLVTSRVAFWQLARNSRHISNRSGC